jgi:hypothetical protein
MNYEKIATLSGLYKAIELLQLEIREIESELVEGKEGKEGREEKSKKASYWSKMTPEERVAEMKKRIKARGVRK